MLDGKKFFFPFRTFVLCHPQRGREKEKSVWQNLALAGLDSQLSPLIKDGTEGQGREGGVKGRLQVTFSKKLLAKPNL